MLQGLSMTLALIASTLTRLAGKPVLKEPSMHLCKGQTRDSLDVRLRPIDWTNLEGQVLLHCQFNSHSSFLAEMRRNFMPENCLQENKKETSRKEDLSFALAFISDFWNGNLYILSNLSNRNGTIEPKLTGKACTAEDLATLFCLWRHPPSGALDIN